MADILIHQPIWAGAITFVLGCLDWVLTVLQHREKQAHYQAHYATYPVDTVEGNPLLQARVQRGKLFDPRHHIPILVFAIGVGFLLTLMNTERVALFFLGAVWGTFLMVIAAHLRNLLVYRAGRRGVHGKIYLHQRTGYRMAIGQYGGALFLTSSLVILVPHPFLVGVVVAAVLAVVRQVVFLFRVPRIEPDDPGPSEAA